MEEQKRKQKERKRKDEVKTHKVRLIELLTMDFNI